MMMMLIKYVHDDDDDDDDDRCISVLLSVIDDDDAYWYMILHDDTVYISLDNLICMHDIYLYFFPTSSLLTPSSLLTGQKVRSRAEQAPQGPPRALPPQRQPRCPRAVRAHAGTRPAEAHLGGGGAAASVPRSASRPFWRGAKNEEEEKIWWM